MSIEEGGSQLTVQHDNIVLSVRGLTTYFDTEDGVVKAVDGVDLDVYRGEVLGLVGESGCGKSVTSLSIMRLVGMPGNILAGKVLFNDRDLLALDESDMRQIRGNQISMIFQQPNSCLNPVFKAGSQVEEQLKVHLEMSNEEAKARAVELFETVGIPDPKRRVEAYPHELSGGMAQRVMIAMALSCAPELLIADEPTTALDVTIQAQILDLMRNMRDKLETSFILITHNMGVIAEMADRVAVMYAGKIIEHADVNTIFTEPQHPYTQKLLASIPIMGVVQHRLTTIPGTVPNLINLPPGCRFAPRCEARVEHKLERCTKEEPELLPIGPRHTVRCWLYR
jgi:oligopeptide/dipeptide ABC transporter ATP-binding protein